MGEADVPVELSRLWRLGAESRLGRPAKLDVDRVVRAAVELADREGLGGVTLPKVAETLGVTKMSLYRHVGSKDELLVLMADLASGPPPEISAAAGRWRDGLREWSVALAATLRRHSWLVRVPTSGPPSGPNHIAWMDAALRVLRDSGLDWGEKVGVVSVVSGYVGSASRLALDLEEGRRGSGLEQAQVERDYGRALAELVDPRRFPEAAALFASGVFEPPPGPSDDEPVDHDFVFGLELILDGVAVAVETAARQTGGGTTQPSGRL
ncbi:MAG: TetR/AcrR family transcriptional regulator [Stackebrandtia sp.]